MKQLITADALRTAHAEGKTRIEITLPDCIVTAEARMVAERLGVEIIEVLANKPLVASSSLLGAATAAPVVEYEANLAAIRQAVLAQLPSGSVPENVIDQLVRKVAAEQATSTSAPTAAAVAAYESITLKSGIKRVTGSSVKMGLLEGAGANQIGIADVITGADGSTMAAGFMQWENSFFPWTLRYDEIDIVLDGELHIRCDGETAIAKAGDVIFIPKNSSIEFGTPSKVSFLYVAYPANWQDC
ncbi:ethanolamine utilization acetate kinase EutQ [Iodobacter fluviatilis]|uniref:Ethanolamine utilization protein EutQ n=1 Tax=Iodobacter fluviatilis TaxID=537 RepID=A0A377STJ9_9NEIS|nr:ethanolamine utilization acetate kinase EutQ [Iodobacter fluviatilis]TCU87851.1 ethanolamine utilization protein EutQ [Iodobacter fluviatilis]STR45352.1 Ethanolamine utilization protein eutQ [Iodobacter fluviatilis]